MRQISRDSTDEDFRRRAAKLIDSAKHEIIVITGEISAYGYADLKWAAERARDRNVTVKVYASSPSPDITNSLLARGIEIFIGPRVKNHYLVVDSNSFILSNPHARENGRRTGELHESDSSGAAKVKAQFETLLARAKPLRKIDWSKDTLRRVLDKPVDWGVDTHASRLDEEFA